MNKKNLFEDIDDKINRKKRELEELEEQKKDLQKNMPFQKGDLIKIIPKNNKDVEGYGFFKDVELKDSISKNIPITTVLLSFFKNEDFTIRVIANEYNFEKINGIPEDLSLNTLEINKPCLVRLGHNKPWKAAILEEINFFDHPYRGSVAYQTSNGVMFSYFDCIPYNDTLLGKVTP